MVKTIDEVPDVRDRWSCINRVRTMFNPDTYNAMDMNGKPANMNLRAQEVARYLTENSGKCVERNSMIILIK